MFIQVQTVVPDRSNNVKMLPQIETTPQMKFFEIISVAMFQSVGGLVKNAPADRNNRADENDTADQYDETIIKKFMRGLYLKL